jgi:hypothetical protein
MIVAHHITSLLNILRTVLNLRRLECREIIRGPGGVEDKYSTEQARGDG